MTKIIPINDGWEFTEKYNDNFATNEGRYEQVRIPHTCKEISYNYCDVKDYQMICGYRKTFVASQDWMGRSVFVKFMAAGHFATVYLNGQEIGHHAGGYTAFELELTSHLKFEKENVLVVKLDTSETLNQPPFGYVIDYMTYGGLYREVYLEIKEASYIQDVHIHADHEGKIRCRTQIVNVGEVSLSIYDADKEIACESGTDIQTTIEGITPWELDNPKLYTAKIRLSQDGRVVDEKRIRFAFRSAGFEADGFYLNDKKRKLIGLNRHQSFPYVGYAMPKSMQRRDADILKYELGVNMVRTSHYPQSQHFVDRCDEIGLLVFTEIPGWQHIGDDAWKEIALNNVKEMILQYRNHPSIVLWGVRINESQDDDEFYQATNALAKKLDPYRATTGVRFLEKSSLLEDVYAHNDFSYEGKDNALKSKKRVTPDMKKAYIVSECNGHMFPTKSFDNESHRVAHALRQAAVIEAMESSEDIAGVLSWCMFDYNTHKDFGSGDGICYHGVMDMFRNPKLAAAVYASQGEIPVCEVASSMDIGEHPAGKLGNIYVFTNADEIKLYKNNEYLRSFYPDREHYPAMKHPPVLIDDLVGNQILNHEKYDAKTAAELKEVLLAVLRYGQDKLPIKYKLKMAKLVAFKHLKVQDGVDLYLKYVGNWGGEAPVYRFDAIKNGEVFQSVEKKPGSKVRLEADVAQVQLMEGETYDVAAVRVRAVDAYHNLMPYFAEPITLTAKGNIEIIGPKVIATRGGYAGTYVKSTGSGSGQLTLTCEGYNGITIDFTVRKE